MSNKQKKSRIWETPTLHSCPARDDMSCASCGRKGHMARDCRRPALTDKSKRPCFGCQKTGHMARDCLDKPKALKMIADAQPRQLFMSCVEAVDREGFRLACRHQPRNASILDFIATAAAPKRASSNRYRPPTTEDLLPSDSVIQTQHKHFAI